MVGAIEQYMSDQVTWTLPRGGFFLWVALSNQFFSKTVRNLAAWYRAFKMKPGEKLYLAPKNRMKIW